MKRTLSLILLLGVMLVFTGPAIADEEDPYGITMVEEQEEEGRLQSICPRTLRNDGCMTCHTSPNFKLKEGDPDEGRSYPNFSMKVRNDTGYLWLTTMTPSTVWEFFDYLKAHNIFRAVIEIYSGGGGLFDGATIASYINAFPGYVETRVPGFAASAACLVFLAGDKRYIDPMGFLMWHELLSFEFLAVKTPSDKEDEARILRMVQSTIHQWFAGRTKMQKDEIDEKVRKKEFWVNGEDAVRLGFADGYITKQEE